MGKTRQSNIELLRLVAIFMVLIVHADFSALGEPTKEVAQSEPLSSFARFLFEALSIVCVDVFVLISGYFGIHPSKRGILNLIFQCGFYSCGIYIVMLLLGHATLGMKNIADCLLLSGTYWFVKAYILLYLLSPMLNAFIEFSSLKQVRNVLLTFFVFQTIFGFISDGLASFENGYSTISFMGLYLLGRYVKINYEKFNFTPPYKYIIAYCGICVSVAALAMLSTYFTGFQFQRLYTYTNPLVIIASLSLLLYFSKLHFTSKIVNWLASSAFAIYLFHTNENLFLPYFVSEVKDIYNDYQGLYCLILLIFYLLCISIVSILIDKIRMFIWNFILKRYAVSCQKKV